MSTIRTTYQTQWIQKDSDERKTTLMKKIISFCLFAVLLLSSYIPASANDRTNKFMFRDGITWGMSLEDIQKAENSDGLVIDGEDGITRLHYDSVTADGVDGVQLNYAFLNDSLFFAQYYKERSSDYKARQQVYHLNNSLYLTFGSPHSITVDFARKYINTLALMNPEKYDIDEFNMEAYAEALNEQLFAFKLDDGTYIFSNIDISESIIINYIAPDNDPSENIEFDPSQYTEDELREIEKMIHDALPKTPESTVIYDDTQNSYDLNTLNEEELISLADSLKDSLSKYGYIIQYEKINDEANLLEEATNYPTDLGIVVEKCTWEMNNDFYSPMIKVEVRNNTGTSVKKIQLQVVFYDDEESKVWDDKSTYLISSSDAPLKNGFSKTALLRSTWGYKKYVDSDKLPDISYEIYINGELYFDGIVEKPGTSKEIQTAISAAKKLKSMLKNPSSIQLHEAYIEKTNSNPSIVLNISAQNGFGGLNRKYYKCTMSGTTCINVNEYEYFELLYKSDYTKLDVSLIAPSVEEK